MYKNVFLYYTQKQWGLTPEEVDPSVTARVPVFISRDNRYFQDAYQGMPLDGYTPLFENMLSHDNIVVCLDTEAESVFDLKFVNGAEDSPLSAIAIKGQDFDGPIVYTARSTSCSYPASGACRTARSTSNTRRMTSSTSCPAARSTSR